MFIVSVFSSCADFRTLEGDTKVIVIHWVTIENASLGRQQAGDQELLGDTLKKSLLWI